MRSPVLASNLVVYLYDDKHPMNWTEPWTSHRLRGTLIEEEGYYGLVPLSSIMSTVKVFRSSVLIMTFTDNLPWPLHPFYMNLFITMKGLQQIFDPDSSNNATDDN